MQWKLTHNPIAFAEFPIKIVCASWQSYNITEGTHAETLEKISGED
jgi:hypothetical protein